MRNPKNSRKTAATGTRPNPIPGNKPFKKGQSGNPKGRPRKLPELDTILADVLGEETGGVSAAEAILKKLMQLARRGNIRAAELLLDRGYGKATQRVEGKVDHTVSKVLLPRCLQDDPPESHTSAPKPKAG